MTLLHAEYLCNGRRANFLRCMHKSVLRLFCKQRRRTRHEGRTKLLHRSKRRSLSGKIYCRDQFLQLQFRKAHLTKLSPNPWSQCSADALSGGVCMACVCEAVRLACARQSLHASAAVKCRCGSRYGTPTLILRSYFAVAAAVNQACLSGVLRIKHPRHKQSRRSHSSFETPRFRRQASTALLLAVTHKSFFKTLRACPGT